MNWTPADAEPIDTVRPLTRERIIALFEREGWHYIIDEDGDLASRWDNGVFYFMPTGPDKDILHIGSWMCEGVPLDLLDEFCVFIEDWHRDTIWPKAYHTFQENGTLRLNADIAIGLEAGITDTQLKYQIQEAIGTTGQLYDAARERFGITPSTDRPS